MEKKKTNRYIIVAVVLAIVAIIISVVLITKKTTPDPKPQNPEVTMYCVTFMDGENKLKMIEVEENKTIDESSIPSIETKEGYQFEYWKLGETQFDFSTVITSDIILVAHWIELGPTIIDPTAIKLSASSQLLARNKTFTLKATVTPTDATDTTVTYKSSDTNVAKVDSNGKVTGVGKGTCKITVTTSNGISATCTVEVFVAVESINITADRTVFSYYGVNTVNFTATVLPADADINVVKWSISGDVGGQNGSYSCQINGNKMSLNARELSAYNKNTSTYASVTNADGSVVKSNTIDVYAEAKLSITYTTPLTGSSNENLIYSHGTDFKLVCNEKATFSINGTSATSYNGEYVAQAHVDDKELWLTLWNNHSHVEGIRIDISTPGGQVLKVNDKKGIAITIIQK